MAEPSAWLKVVLEGEGAEDLAGVFAETYRGVEVLSPTRIALYIPSLEYSRELLTAQAKSLALCICEESPFAERNWVAESEELLRPVQRASFTIVPLPEGRSPESIRLPGGDSFRIYIRPGMGFGTGHHATTAMPLELLCDGEVAALLPTHALDVGTGSGILALCLAARYQTSVDGVDIDADALANAEENLTLNADLARHISLLKGGVEVAPRDHYPLVVANLYAELLAKLSAELIARVAPGGYLVVSGILETLEHEVRPAFSSLRLMRRLSEDGWVALRYQRV